MQLVVGLRSLKHPSCVELQQQLVAFQLHHQKNDPSPASRESVNKNKIIKIYKKEYKMKLS
jgi:hypothetical protein